MSIPNLEDTLEQMNVLAWDDVRTGKWISSIKSGVDGHNYNHAHQTITPIQAFSKSIYLAGGWFNSTQQHDLEVATQVLTLDNDSVGYIHVPLLHQYKDTTIDNDPQGIFGGYEWSTETFKADITAMQLADVIVALYDSNEPDSGTSWEQGYMYALGKPIVLVDVNATKPVNLMDAKGLTYHCESWEELLTLDFNSIMPKPYAGEVF